MKLPPLATPYRSDRLTGALLLVLVGWFLLTTAYHGAINPQSGVTGGDFKFFYQAAQRLNAGKPLYVHEASGATYVYTPLLALLLRPIAAIAGEQDGPTPALALKLWYACSAASLVAAIALFALAMRWTLRQAALIAIVAIVAFRFWPTTMTFGLGQNNLFLVFALAGLYWADSHDKPLATAGFITLGTLFKTWFIGFALYLLIRRNWKATAACVGFTALSVALLFTIVGWRELPLFVEMTLGYASKQMGNQVLSQSIAGFAQLHFSTNAHINPLRDSGPLAAAVKYAGQLLMLLGLTYLFLRPAVTLSERRLHLSLVALTVLLLLPYCQTEYLVLALPPLWCFLTQPRLGGWFGFLGAAVVYVLLTRGGPYYPNDAQAYRSGVRSLLVSLPFLMLFLLWLITFTTLIRHVSATLPSSFRTPSTPVPLPFRTRSAPPPAGLPEAP